MPLSDAPIWFVTDRGRPNAVAALGHSRARALS
jgi:hypothetical protein